MIYLYENTENLIILSLKEKTTISNATYLFRFVNKQSQQETSCISAAIDEYEYGRQSFNITTVSSGANNLLGEIVLTLGSEYEYYIYAQSSTTNLDYTLANEQVECGLMKYYKNIEDRTNYERGNTERKTYIRQ